MTSTFSDTYFSNAQVLKITAWVLYGNAERKNAAGEAFSDGNTFVVRYTNDPDDYTVSFNNALDKARDYVKRRIANKLDNGASFSQVKLTYDNGCELTYRWNNENGWAPQPKTYDPNTLPEQDIPNF